ncbi:hypothetical protein M436DRAFT_67179 [Aureobasidium namibiae CBS 147.97]|uniref:Uncharacterized protein n=1 Tax=Aureobasidium namibiae CBS 147.97 TaxID=1043004 RepID=A0A074WDA4_9PEZI
MARLPDLPPEVPLNIYRLLLVDPIQEGLRVTFTIELSHSDRMICRRTRCTQTDLPHQAGHSAHPCHLDALLATIHHFDFTDLMSLARANRTLYIEASQTVYNNVDLTLEFYRSPSPARPTSASELLHRYLGQHCARTLEMIPSLIIHDELALMSPGDADSIVCLVNTQLPNLKVLGYHLMASGGSSLPLILRSFCRKHCRAISTIQPFVNLQAQIHTNLDLPVPPEVASLDPQLYIQLCGISKDFAERALQTIKRLQEFRKVMRDQHALALERGRYLHATLFVRSSPNARVSKQIPGFEAKLVAMHSFGVLTGLHRQMLRVTRGSR